MITDKKLLRQHIRALVAQLSPEEKATEAQIVFSHIEKNDIFAQARNIMLYASLPDELPTAAVLERWSKTKNIFLPRVNGNELDVLRYDHDKMASGSYSIMEPTGNETVSPTIIDLVIVPARAFDRHGNRLGRGKGYYDIFLSKATQAVTIGVCLNCQLLSRVPAEAHDITMNYIVTPSFKTL